MKKIGSFLILMLLTATFAIPAFAANNSCVEMEIISDGTLDATWTEHTALEWTAYDPGDENYTYRWSTSTGFDVGWSISSAHLINRSQNIVMTMTNDNDTFSGVVFLYESDPLWYGVLCTDGAAFIVKYNGVLAGWSGIDWDDSFLNWYPYEYSHMAPSLNLTWMKTIFDQHTGHLMWKAWTEGLDDGEPTTWVIDMSMAEWNTDETYQFGLCGYNNAPGVTYVDFGMYGLFNCTYELDTISHAYDVPVLQPKIIDSTVLFAFMINAMTELFENEGNWSENQMRQYLTGVLVEFVNWFDHSSFIYYPIGEGDQDDQIYVYSIVLRDFLSMAEIIPAEYMPWNQSDWDEIMGNETMSALINNFIVFLIEDCTDGTDDDNDWCLLQFDSDHNHVYDDEDYSFVVYGNSSSYDTESFNGSYNTNDSMFMAEVSFGDGPQNFCFHRYDYHRSYMIFIPLGLLESNHTTGTMANVNDTMGINIVLSNNDTGDSDLYCWEQWIELTNVTNPISNFFAFGTGPTFNISDNQCQQWGHLCIQGVNAGTGADEPDLNEIYTGVSSGFTQTSLTMLWILIIIMAIIIIVGLVTSRGK
jgi:hypothetical protein